MIHTKAHMERKYATVDPWGYRTNPHDIERKRRILAALEPHAPFERALDIGAGEGWITQDLPARYLNAYELSDQAARRLPPRISRIVAVREPVFDLVTATGVFYRHYEWEAMQDLARRAIAPGGLILTCHIEDSEISLTGYEEIHTERFPYRKGRAEVLRLFRA